MIRSIAISCVLGAVFATAPAFSVQGAVPDTRVEARRTGCNRNTYVSKVKAVAGVTDIGISSMWVHTYPGKTVIHRSQTITVNHRTTLKAGISTTVGASLSAGAMLKKVVHAFAEVHAETTYKGSIGTTRREAKTIVQEETTTIPGGKTVVWFVGHKKVQGTFKYSSCDHEDGRPRDDGQVHWHSSHWRSFAIREDGGQRCDLKGNTSVARAAKVVGCS